MKLKTIRKKGDFSDTLILIVFMFVFGIGIFVLAYIWPIIFEGMRTNGINSTVEGNTAINQMIAIGSGGLSRGFVVIFIGLVISTMITSFLIRQNPIFLFLNIITLIISVVLAVYLSNAYDQFTSNPIFAATALANPLIAFVMNNAVIIIIVVGAIDMIITYVGFQSGGGGIASPL
jgi:hypothetical protein